MRTRLQFLAAALLVLGMDGNAAILVYQAPLNGSSESPPTVSPGTGYVIVTVDTIAQTLEVNVTFSGLTAGNTAAHIHCCTIDPLAGNAGVATTTPTFPGFPSGSTSGSYDHVLDLTQASSFNPAFVTANVSVAGAQAALLTGLANNRAYFNIHTTTFPGGEIRGFLPDRIFGNGFETL